MTADYKIFFIPIALFLCSSIANAADNIVFVCDPTRHSPCPAPFYPTLQQAADNVKEPDGMIVVLDDSPGATISKRFKGIYGVNRPKITTPTQVKPISGSNKFDVIGLKFQNNFSRLDPTLEINNRESNVFDNCFFDAKRVSLNQIGQRSDILHNVFINNRIALGASDAEISGHGNRFSENELAFHTDGTTGAFTDSVILHGGKDPKVIFGIISKNSNITFEDFIANKNIGGTVDAKGGHIEFKNAEIRSSESDYALFHLINADLSFNDSSAIDNSGTFLDGSTNNLKIHSSYIDTADSNSGSIPTSDLRAKTSDIKDSYIKERSKMRVTLGDQLTLDNSQMNYYSLEFINGKIDILKTKLSAHTLKNSFNETNMESSILHMESEIKLSSNQKVSIDKSKMISKSIQFLTSREVIVTGSVLGFKNQGSLDLHADKVNISGTHFINPFKWNLDRHDYRSNISISNNSFNAIDFSVYSPILPTSPLYNLQSNFWTSFDQLQENDCTANNIDCSNRLNSSPAIPKIEIQDKQPPVSLSQNLTIDCEPLSEEARDYMEKLGINIDEYSTPGSQDDSKF